MLVHAHREELALHAPARRLLERLTEEGTSFAVPVFVLGEFLDVATNPAVLHPPSTLPVALQVVGAVLSAPGGRLLAPGQRFPALFRQVLRGGMSESYSRALDFASLFDRRVARRTPRPSEIVSAQLLALCLERRVEMLVTADPRLQAFEGLRVRTIEEAAEAA